MIDWIVSHQEASHTWALDEVARAGRGLLHQESLDPEMTLVRTDYYPRDWRPVFVRHRFPVQTTCKPELAALKLALEPMASKIKKQWTFSVQVRALDDAPLAAREVEKELIAQLESRGTYNKRKPQQVVSVVLGREQSWIGLSEAKTNLSPWNGGEHHLARSEEQVSRAEFKLVEALDVFRLRPNPGQFALDLGAAPGGWSRVLQEKGLRVTAVDPAALDSRLAGIEHYRMTAQRFLKKAEHRYHWLVNDMRMDALESVELTLHFLPLLHRNATVILTLKLPQSEGLAKLEAARELLAKGYEIRGLRQLFHNRSEVTAQLAPRTIKRSGRSRPKPARKSSGRSRRGR